jgi:hypothetical protein
VFGNEIVAEFELQFEQLLLLHDIVRFARRRRHSRIRRRLCHRSIRRRRRRCRRRRRRRRRRVDGWRWLLGGRCVRDDVRLGCAVASRARYARQRANLQHICVENRN